MNVVAPHAAQIKQAVDYKLSKCLRSSNNTWQDCTVQKQLHKVIWVGAGLKLTENGQECWVLLGNSVCKAEEPLAFFMEGRAEEEDVLQCSWKLQWYTAWKEAEASLVLCPVSLHHVCKVSTGQHLQDSHSLVNLKAVGASILQLKAPIQRKVKYDLNLI